MAKGLGISTSAIGGWFERLTDREKKLVVGFAVALFVILIGGGFYFLYSKGSERRQEIDEMQQMSIQIENLRPQYASARAKNEALEAKLARTRVDLFVRVPDAVRTSGLPPATVDPITLSPKEGTRKIKGKDVKEDRVSVKLTFTSSMSIDRLTTLLSAIEGDEGGEVVKVMNINIKPNSRTPDLLDVTDILVSTWKQG